MSDITGSDFRFIDINTIQAEKITAPRYSYWASVFRVFFRKKVNIILIALFVLLIVFSFVIPMIFPYNSYENVPLNQVNPPNGKKYTLPVWM